MMRVRRRWVNGGVKRRFLARAVLSFGVRWPCHRFVFAGLAGGIKRIENAKAAGKAGDYKAVARPPHSERKHRPRDTVTHPPSP